MRKYRLMIPGPIELAPEVLSIMSEPLVAHYGQEWAAFYKETTGLARQVFRTEGNVFLVPGSGSAGLDMALGSTLFPNKKVLIPQNGFFGERLEEIARTYTSNIHILKFPLGQKYDLEVIKKALQSSPCDVMLAVHCETSTGVINPIQELAQVSHDYGAVFIVDAISSLAIEPLEMDTWGIDICVSASQKGLESPPGLTLIGVSQKVWDKLESKRPGWYLNLKVWKDYEEKWGNWHPHPVTQAVSIIRALRVGLERIHAEGLEARFKRHKEITRMLREGLLSLGFSLLTKDDCASHGVTTVFGPQGQVEELLKLVQDRHNLLLAGGLGELKGKVFRIGHMGPNATQETVNIVLSALEDALNILKAQ